MFVTIYYLVKDLAPGAKYIIKVYPFNVGFKGPDEKLEITTKGKIILYISKLFYYFSNPVLYLLVLSDDSKIFFLMFVFAFNFPI